MKKLFFCTALFFFIATLNAKEANSDTYIEKVPDFHFVSDISFTYGIGIYSAMGVQLHNLGQLSSWNTKYAYGSFDVGVLLGFQAEPQALQYMSTEGIDTETYRLNSWVTIGKSFFMGRKRNYALGLHFFGGWTHVWSKAVADRDDLDFNSEVSDNYGHYNFGGILRFDWKFYKYLGMSLHAAAPFPVGPSYVNTLFHVGIGLAIYPF